MGQSTDAILFYGYQWDMESRRPWKQGDSDDEDDDGWEERYAKTKGVLPPTVPFPDDAMDRRGELKPTATDSDRVALEEYRTYFARKREVTGASTCIVDTHCSSEYPMPFVAIRKSILKAYRGSPQKVTSIDVDPAWNDQLKEFCELMGIKPPEEGPKWWLVSDWT